MGTGGSKGKATVTTLSNTLNEVIISTVQSCEVAAYQDQNVMIKNTGFWFWGTSRVTQQSDIAVECFSDRQIELDLQNRVANTIANSASATGQAIWPAFGNTKAVADTNITNIIRNTISLSNVQRTYISLKQNQGVGFENSGVAIFVDNDFIQGSKIFAMSTLKELDKTKIFNTIENYVDQTADATQAGPFDLIIKALTILVIIIILIAGVVGGIWLYNRSDQDSAGLYNRSDQKNVVMGEVYSEEASAEMPAAAMTPE